MPRSPGRPSKLTERQWGDVEKRLLAGQATIRGIAREYGMAESAVRKRFKGDLKAVKVVAQQVFEAEEAFASLSKPAQLSARALIDDLRAISTNLASAAKFGAQTANRLAEVAHNQAIGIKPDGTLAENAVVLSSVKALTDISNEAARTGLNLLAANKRSQAPDEPPEDHRTPEQIRSDTEAKAAVLGIEFRSPD